MSRVSHKRAVSFLPIFLLVFLVKQNNSVAEAEPLPFEDKHQASDYARQQHLYGRLLGDFNCDQVAFYKTHKTGSTNLGAIMFRVGVRHGKRFHTMTGLTHYLNANMESKPADFIVNHSKSPLRAMQSAYKKYLGGHPGRLTIVRDPVERYISEYYYNVKPENPRGMLGGPRVQPVRNRMTQYMVGEPADSLSSLADFFGSEEWHGTVFLRVERMEEGLAALHLHCGWPVKYLLNVNVNCADCGRPLSRWDGRVVERHGEVSAEVRKQIAELHQKDTMLVEAVESKWRGVQARGGEVLQAVAAEVKRQQALVEGFCRELEVQSGAMGGRRPACLWLSLSDLEYEELVNPVTGHVDMNTTVHMKDYAHPGAPSMRLQDMIADYDRVYDQIVGSSQQPYDDDRLHHRHQDVGFPKRGRHAKTRDRRPLKYHTEPLK